MSARGGVNTLGGGQNVLLGGVDGLHGLGVEVLQLRLEVGGHLGQVLQGWAQRGVRHFCNTAKSTVSSART